MLLPKLEIREEKIPGTELRFTMVKVPGGELKEHGKVLCEVGDFWIGQGLVTQELWKEIERKNPSRIRGKLHPVNSVDWYDAAGFCNSLSQKMKLPSFYSNSDLSRLIFFDFWPFNKDTKVRSLPKGIGKEGFRLLTEVEWEHAARSLGALYRYSGSHQMKKVGWYKRNSLRQSHDVNMKLPNSLGLFDMSGNLLEWCHDWFGKKFPSAQVKDPQGINKGEGRVLRGGSWFFNENKCLVSHRLSGKSDHRADDIGFRLARTAF